MEASLLPARQLEPQALGPAHGGAGPLLAPLNARKCKATLKCQMVTEVQLLCEARGSRFLG